MLWVAGTGRRAYGGRVSAGVKQVVVGERKAIRRMPGGTKVPSVLMLEGSDVAWIPVMAALEMPAVASEKKPLMPVT